MLTQEHLNALISILVYMWFRGRIRFCEGIVWILQFPSNSREIKRLKRLTSRPFILIRRVFMRGDRNRSTRAEPHWQININASCE